MAGRRAEEEAGSSGAAKRKMQEVEEDYVTYLWTVNNYSTVCNKTVIWSPVFRGGPKSQHQWQLKLNPRKFVQGQEWTGVFLVFRAFGGNRRNDNTPVKARFSLSITDSFGTTWSRSGSGTKKVEFKALSCWGSEKFLKTSIIKCTAPNFSIYSLAGKAKPILIRMPPFNNDILQIRCRIWIEVEKDTAGNKRAREECIKKILASSDLVVKTKTKSLKVHKSILVSRSKVFEKMIRESKTDIIQIPDFEFEVVERMLQCLYTGELHAPPKMALEMFQISSIYGIKGLRELCEMFIAGNLNVETATDVLVLSCLHNAIALKCRVIYFINKNRANVLKTQAYQKVVAQTQQFLFVANLLKWINFIHKKLVLQYFIFALHN